MAVPGLVQRLTMWAILNGGAGVLIFAALPDWWLSSLILLALAATCMVAAITLEAVE